MNILKPSTMQRYILRQFLSTLGLCLLAATTVFFVFEFFERMRVFLREGSTFIQAASYMLFKIPLIIHLMMPVAVLIATLLTIGRLSQLSEITAMRACGASLVSLVKPLLAAGLLISALMFVLGETVVPAATEKVEQIYEFDIKKKSESGRLSRWNFWYRDKKRFYNIGLYDSRTSQLNSLSIFYMDNSFRMRKRVDAQTANWNGPIVGWSMHDVVETSLEKEGSAQTSTFTRLPLVISEKPEDFYNMKRLPETLSYTALKEYTEKLARDGVPVAKYRVALASKISFPLVNFIVILIAFPFALTPARSGTMTLSFVAGVSIGFGYHIVHALSTALASGELLPVAPAAWTANILLGCIGGYLLMGMEKNH